MAWRGTNSIRRFDAQDDHNAQPLLTHSDRTASSTGAMPVRPTEPVPPNRVAIVTGLGGGICRYLCDTVGLTSPERLAASPVGTVDAPDTPTGPAATSVTTAVTESHISAEAAPRTRRQIA
jgi:hypothetical protein